MKSTILTIDPGASGGLAWTDETGLVHAEPMPEGMSATADRLRELKFSLPGLRAVVERTGTPRPTDAKPAASKFARHCGHLEALTYAYGIPTEEVAPRVWQRALGALPAEKTERKRAIREMMQRHHPHLRVTMKTADALGILFHAIREGRK